MQPPGSVLDRPGVGPHRALQQVGHLAGHGKAGAERRAGIDRNRLAKLFPQMRLGNQLVGQAPAQHNAHLAKCVIGVIGVIGVIAAFQVYFEQLVGRAGSVEQIDDRVLGSQIALNQQARQAVKETRAAAVLLF